MAGIVDLYSPARHAIGDRVGCDMAAPILVVDQLPKGGAIGANIAPRKIEAKLRSEPAQACSILLINGSILLINGCSNGMSTVNV